MALNIDENEDVGLVRKAWRDRGLTEPVSIAPTALTQTLIQEFGPEIVTPPQAPIVLISANQTSARLLPRGLKSAAELADHVAKGR